MSGGKPALMGTRPGKAVGKPKDGNASRAGDEGRGLMWARDECREV